VPLLVAVVAWLGVSLVPLLVAVAAWLGASSVPLLVAVVAWLGVSLVPLLVAVAAWLGASLVPLLVAVEVWLGVSLVALLELAHLALQILVRLVHLVRPAPLRSPACPLFLEPLVRPRALLTHAALVSLVCLLTLAHLVSLISPVALVGLAALAQVYGRVGRVGDVCHLHAQQPIGYVYRHLCTGKASLHGRRAQTFQVSQDAMEHEDACRPLDCANRASHRC
jgi:hypothetical protein